MSENSTEPKTITQGDSVSWEISITDYPASDGWELSYAMVKEGALVTIPSTASGDKYLVEIDTVATAAYSDGVYSWTATVKKLTERRTIRQGMLEVLPDLSQQTDGADLRSQIKRTLDAINDAIERQAASGVISVAVAGRTTTWRTFDELIALRDRYLADYNRELVAAGIRKPRNRYLVSF